MTKFSQNKHFSRKNWRRLIVCVWLSLILVLGFKLNLAAQVSPSALVQQAQQQYQLGNSVQALELLVQAEEIYQSQGQVLPQAQVWALTSLAQQQQGKWQLAQANLERSWEAIASVAASPEKTQVQAQIWNTQGHYSFATGQYSQALSNWQQAEKRYRQLEDPIGIAGTGLSQGEALGKMGFHRRACDRALKLFTSESEPEFRCKSLTTEQITTIIQQAQGQQPWLVEGLNSVGNSLLSMGQLNFAQRFILASDHSARDLPFLAPTTKAKITLSLGNIHQAIALQAKQQGNSPDFLTHSRLAIEYFQQLDLAANTPVSSHYQLAAQLNQLTLLIVSQNWTAAATLANQIKLVSDYQPNLYNQVKFANSLALLQDQKLSIQYSRRDIADIYFKVIKQAQLSGDSRLESYGWGNLGEIWQEQLHLEQTPQQLYEKALLLGQAAQSPEIIYRWQWRLGQIYRQQGLKSKAIASYQAALANLNSLRGDLVALEKEVQYEFKDQIEPVYRELTDLLLTGSPNNQDLEAARNVIEALQVAELDNYFQDACLTFEPKSIDQIDPHAAIIYTIVLPDRLEVIMATSDRSNTGQVFHHHTQKISQTELEQTIQQLRSYLTEPDRTREVQQLSAQIYTWLMAPLMDDLAIQRSQTLVFVLDGMLQTIPMAALYDGQQYLIEKYAIALTPGLRLLNDQVDSRPLSFLAGGISQYQKVEDQSFAPLAYVTEELKAASQLEHPLLLNQQFTPSNLLAQLNTTAASVVHLATHGQFSSNPQQTFLLMWNKILSINEFSRIIQNRLKIERNPVKLLVLSACDTASGDRRAALGLAGIAVRSGALSTLATLWQINDDSTAQLMKNFYHHLKKHSQAEALRRAQLDLWQTTAKDWQVPAFWSGYVIIGNWQ
ncbi:MAG: CHAT domain-containing protein [Waterburya sp.]